MYNYTTHGLVCPACKEALTYDVFPDEDKEENARQALNDHQQLYCDFFFECSGCLEIKPIKGQWTADNGETFCVVCCSDGENPRVEAEKDLEREFRQSLSHEFVWDLKVKSIKYN